MTEFKLKHPYSVLVTEMCGKIIKGSCQEKIETGTTVQIKSKIAFMDYSNTTARIEVYKRILLYGS
jgi:hypothetical protein